MLNKIENIQLQKNGIGDEMGVKKLFRVSENNPGMNKIIDDGSTDNNTAFTEIEIKRMDDFVKDLKIEKISIVKIDVEGYELKVLKGAQETIKKYLPIICLEVVNSLLLSQKSSANEVLEFIKNLGYSKFLDAHTMREIKNFNKDFNCDVICLPKLYN